MTHHEFCVWLHGFTELTGTKQPTEPQWKMIVEHLDLMFTKVTPKLGEQFPELGKPLPALPAPFPSYPPLPADRVFPLAPNWLKQQDGTPWPPGTIIC